ncbi:MAG: methyltransferase domain-containing protein [Anaerolineae bacterium]
MAKQGEIDYIQQIGPVFAEQALNKPFSADAAGRYLLDMGAVMCILPPPPARLLDIGVGTGWTSVFLALRGYTVVGQDIAPDMIALAEQNRQRYSAPNLTFVVGDFEGMEFSEEFDCALFYDALHHAVDERAAIAKAYNALRSGGICITVEPGEGHSQDPFSQEAMRLWGVTEKDMPPHHIIALAQEIGFKTFKVYGRRFDAELLYDSAKPSAPATASGAAPTPEAEPPMATPSRLQLLRHGLAAVWRGVQPQQAAPASAAAVSPLPSGELPIYLRASNIVLMAK